ncbi:MAG: LytR family transcriptional regulator [Ruminococcaceae bacterium]|nr:LytR family transcriptional regulator [Oscillospiraceae bacterium]
MQWFRKPDRFSVKMRNVMMEQNQMNKPKKSAEPILWGILIFAIVAVLSAALFLALYTPNVDDDPQFSTGETSDKDTIGENTLYERKKGFYTFLIAGIDAFSNNTDVLMLASLDTENGKIEIVQIPRDTYVNKTVGGYASLTRVNAIFSAEYNSQTSKGISAKTAKTLAMQDLQKRLSEALCINIDEYVLIDTKGFRSVIDAVGGIDYDVPQDMFYEDPEQELYINLSKGYQHLNGEQCEQLIRYRSGYATGDIGRVELRGDFMTEVFKQVKNKFSLDAMLTLIKDKSLLQKISTSMSPADIFAYVRMCYQLSDDAVNVRTLSGSVVQNPETGAWIYYCLNKQKALDDINECLNVYRNDIEISIFDQKEFFSGTKNSSAHYLYEYYHS